jgi:hypothetical protein
MSLGLPGGKNPDQKDKHYFQITIEMHADEFILQEEQNVNTGFWFMKRSLWSAQACSAPYPYLLWIQASNKLPQRGSGTAGLSKLGINIHSQKMPLRDMDALKGIPT